MGRGRGGFGAPDFQGHILRLHHAVLVEKRMDLLVLLHHEPAQLHLQGLADALQITARQACGKPLIDNMLADDFGAQQVIGRQLPIFERLDPDTQQVEHRMRDVAERQRQARGQDLVFHGIVAEQFEVEPAHVPRRLVPGSLDRLRGSRQRRLLGLPQCVAKHIDAALQPAQLMSREALIRLAPSHGVMEITHAFSHLGQSLPHLPAELRQAVAQTLGPAQTRLQAQRACRRIR